MKNEGHWNGTLPPSDPNPLAWKTVDEPILGFYNSSDPRVVKQHLEWFKELGIGFLIVPWFGSGTLGGNLFNEDGATETIFKTIQENNYPIQVVIMVEEFSNYNFQEIYDYIYAKYANIYTNEYFKLSTKPLVCWWNHPNVTGTYGNPNVTNIQKILGDSRFDARIVGHDDYVNWSAWRPNSLAWQGNSTDPRPSQDGFVCIEPRYDDSHIGGNSTFDEDYSQSLYERQWNWTLEHQADIRIVAIYSWNEYHERSQIEPHNNSDGKYVLTPFNKTYHYITVPEFPSFLLLPIIIVTTVLAIIMSKKKHSRFILG